jgi:uncharacterized protein YegP (UPF0339 family)
MAEETPEILFSIELDNGGVGEVFRSEANEQLYFHLKAANGEILDQSEGYENQEDAQHALSEVVAAEVSEDQVSEEDIRKEANSLKKADLVKLAAEREIEVPAKANKKQLVELIVANELGVEPPSEDAAEETEIPDDALQEDILHQNKLVPAGSPIPDDLTDEQVERFERLGIVK